MIRVQRNFPIVPSIFAGVIFALLTASVHAAEYTWRDLGTDVGTVTTSTMLMDAPSYDGASIAPLPPGSWVIPVSKQPTNGWISCVQFATGHQGWALAARLKIRSTGSETPQNAYVAPLSGTDDQPTLTLQNMTPSHVYVHVPGFDEILMEPHGRKTLSVTPGLYACNAAWADHVPAFQTFDFASGTSAVWRLYTPLKGSPTIYGELDPMLMAECTEIQGDIVTKSVALDNERKSLAEDGARLDRQFAAYDALVQKADVVKTGLDTTDEDALKSYNAMVTGNNAELQKCYDAQDKLNRRRAAYNAAVEKMNLQKERLSAILAFFAGRR